MEIFVWTSEDGSLPEGSRAIARIRAPMKSAKNKTVTDWHPVVILAENADTARAKAQAWWDDQIAAIQRKEDAIKARAARRAGMPINQAHTVEPVIEDDPGIVL